MQLYTFFQFLLVSLVAVVTANPSAPEVTAAPLLEKRQDATTTFDFDDQTTRVVSRDVGGIGLTAALVTTTVAGYDDIKASVIATAADPPMIVYPREPNILVAGAIAVVAICMSCGPESEGKWLYLANV
jgi:hypothetical protein